MNIVEFLNSQYFVFIFYAFVVFLIYINRKKFDFEGIIALLRTKKGLNFIERVSKKHKNFVKILGVVGIGIGYILSFVIMFILFKNSFDLITVPDAKPGVGLVIPGVSIPGSEITVPLWYGLIAIFVVAGIHEFAHGIVARANSIKVNHTGIVFFGPIIGAFVEPDEDEMEKSSYVKKQSMLSAGPFSNIILAGIVFLLISFVLNPIINASVINNGLTVTEVMENTSAEEYGFIENSTITSISFAGIKKDVANSEDFMLATENLRPNDNVTLGLASGSSFNMIVGKNPEDPTKGFFGFTGFVNETESKIPDFLLSILMILFEQLRWIFILTIGIGLANLYPMFITDGARMYEYSFKYAMKDEKKAKKFNNVLNTVCLFILLFNLFFPLLKSVVAFLL